MVFSVRSSTDRHTQDVPQGGLRDAIVGAHVPDRYHYLGANGPVHTRFSGVALLRHPTGFKSQQQLQLASGLTGNRNVLKHHVTYTAFCSGLCCAKPVSQLRGEASGEIFYPLTFFRRQIYHFTPLYSTLLHSLE